MSIRVQLSEIVDALDMLSDDFSAFLDKTAGKVIHISHQALSAAEEEGEENVDEAADWEEDEIAEARDVLSREADFVHLPSKFDIHEYEIMADFCRGYDDPKMSAALCRAIQGSGAFRRFKDLIHDYGITEQWYEFKRRTIKQAAVEWCDAEKIEYNDDVLLPPQPPLPAEQASSALYGKLTNELRELLGDERDAVANAANTAALLYRTMPDVNWIGFYFLKGKDLVLGPFQGRPACARIRLGQGVCGAAGAKRRTIVVANVDEFPGHITCDKASKSEICVPILCSDRLVGVLDIDSPMFGRFDERDAAGIEGLVAAFVELAEWT
jgi:L-methionine (R)-S-oxide reductase